jgi:hypothetical protein
MKLARARHPAIDIVSIDRYVRAAQDTGSRARNEACGVTTSSFRAAATAPELEPDGQLHRPP